ncbi:MAG: hypothetical protein AB1631_33700, partial [Acidobacteriota bacterium]
ELTDRQIKIIFLVIAGINLFLIAMNAPFLVSQVSAEGAVRSASLWDFLKYHCSMKRESVAATWYSSMLLFMAGALALIISATDAHSKRKVLYKVGWILAGLFFIALSIDEIAQIHEDATPFLRSTGRAVEVGAGDWVAAFLPVIVIILAALIFFFVWIFGKEKKSLIIALAAVACWIGAIFAEAIEGGSIYLPISRDVEGMIEEGLEIIGSTLFCFSFVHYLKARQSGHDADARGARKRAAKKSKP